MFAVSIICCYVNAGVKMREIAEVELTHQGLVVLTADLELTHHLFGFHVAELELTHLLSGQRFCQCSRSQLPRQSGYLSLASSWAVPSR